MIPFADNFQAGAVLTLVLPIGLFIALVLWWVFTYLRVPKDIPESATILPPPEIVAAAGDAVNEITPAGPPPGDL